ncbi:MAG: hypothetical protein ACOYX5_03215 [Actinomycetota bacterium]
MRDASADPVSRAGRPLLWVAGFVLLAVLGTFLVLRLGDREVITPTEPAEPASSTDLRADGAATLLADLDDALTDGTRRSAVTLAAPGDRAARRSLGWIHDNVRSLGIGELALRFVEESGVLPDPVRRQYGPDAWIGNVSVSWRVEGYDESTSTMEVPFTFVDTPKGVALGSIGAGDAQPVPLWLLDDLAVHRSPRALVAAADPGQLDRYTTLADQAVKDVRAVLPRWRGRLVVEVPADDDQLHRMLDAEPDTYDSIAAVTATVDGSLSPSSPVHILINPAVFTNLGEDGSQIVMSHEATHVAVDAATSTMPLWLLEGFADYVALARTDLPVEVTASQILAEVRRSGPPDVLPGPDEFDPANKLLGTSYESAWLACKLLAERYGERALVRLYDEVESGRSVREAFSAVGTTEGQFTHEWQDYLRELAG